MMSWSNVVSLTRSPSQELTLLVPLHTITPPILSPPHRLPPPMSYSRPLPRLPTTARSRKPRPKVLPLRRGHHKPKDLLRSKPHPHLLPHLASVRLTRDLLQAGR
uniref:Uncharacterized protein n=1 Tax=Cacopsylla melanoneura TaxID=428564 RepID=A0A8D8LIP2_9HEMI